MYAIGFSEGNFLQIKRSDPSYACSEAIICQHKTEIIEVIKEIPNNKCTIYNNLSDAKRDLNEIITRQNSIKFSTFFTEDLECDSFKKDTLQYLKIFHLIPVTTDVGNILYSSIKNPLTEKDNGYYINRGLFIEIFNEVNNILNKHGDYYDSDDFKVWVGNNTTYILHIPSMTIVSWYKHLGRSNLCNKPLTIDQYKEFAEMFKNDFYINLL